MKSLESAYAASPQEHIITNLTKREVELNETIKAKAGFEKLTNQLKLNKTKQNKYLFFKGFHWDRCSWPTTYKYTNKYLKDFYEALNSSQINPSDADIAEFLNKIKPQDQMVLPRVLVYASRYHSNSERSFTVPKHELNPLLGGSASGACGSGAWVRLVSLHWAGLRPLCCLAA